MSTSTTGSSPRPLRRAASGEGRPERGSRPGPLRHLHRAGVLALVLGVVLAALTERASALRAPVRAASGLSGPWFEADELVVELESVALDCEGAVTCRLAATFRVHSPDGQGIDTRGVFYAPRASSLAVAGAEPADPDDDAQRALRSRAQWLEPTAERDGESRVAAFRVRVAPDEAVLLRVDAELHPGATDFPPGWVLEPAEGRHPFLHGEPMTRPVHEVILHGPMPGIPADVIALRHPAGWESAGPRSARRVPAGGADDVPARAETTAILELSPPGPVLRHGGPVFGLGAVMGSHEASGLRLRAGYEVAVAEEWLLAAISADFDPSGRLIFAATGEAATAHLLFVVPSVSLGVGLPVQVLPRAAVGVRAVATVHLPLIGFVTTVDVFPGLASEAGRVQVTLMGRLSL